MYYESNLRFLCDTLKKCHVSVTFVHPTDSFEKLLDESFKMLFGKNRDAEISIDDFFGKIQPYTIYRATTSFKLYYIYLLLPQTSEETALIIGPYLSAPISSEQIFEIGEKYEISPQKQNLLKAYFESMPVIPENSPIFMLLDTFGEHIWGGSGSFLTEDVNKDLLPEVASFSENNRQQDTEDVLVNMEIMKKRYAFENEIMQAVAQGHAQKAARFMERLSETSFEQRLPDQIRNLKNYSIIMNTLLRKAAEQGGVHPLYLHDISSSFAVRIEQLTSIQAVHQLMSEMLHAYCRLVRKHSMNRYSPTVQKTITLIDFDLSSNLSLSTLASLQNLSPGYLSTVFKRDTGKTVTEYIMDKRMRFAMHLLSTTNLQVQTIAQHCGILDVQYFSKVFKKHTGKTPKEYRVSVK